MTPVHGGDVGSRIWLGFILDRLKSTTVPAAPVIILDRDGVINEDSDAYIKSPDEWVPIPGSLEAMAQLTQAGYRIAVCTNQSGLARGYYDLATLDAMHAKLRALLTPLGGRVDALFYCPHGPDDRCACRKPLPGMFHQVAERFGIELEGVPAVGDSLRDLQAAQAVGAAPILVRTGKGPRTLAQRDALVAFDLAQVPVYDDLAGYVHALLKP